VKILFITSTRIGDAILSTGLLAWLIERHPGARLTVVCGAPAAPLFAAVPGLARLVTVRKSATKLHWLGIWRRCLATRWDLVVDLRRSAIAWGLHARDRRRLAGDDGTLHRVVLLGNTLGLDPPPAPRLWTTAAQEAAAARLLPGAEPVLVLAPTANAAVKVWPAARFAELAGRLTGPGAPLAGARIVVSGGKGEEAMARAVLETLPDGRGLDLVGLDLLTSLAVFRRAALFVGNDSGLMHLAAAAGAPTLGLFGPTRDDLYAPWGPLAAVQRTPESVAALTRGKAEARRAGQSLMTGLTIEAVEAAARELLRRAESGRQAANA
jgi:ADP-heptose:LPS heptosyltransferase